MSKRFTPDPYQRAEQRHIIKPNTHVPTETKVEFWSPRIVKLQMDHYDSLFILSTNHNHKYLKNRLTPIFPGIKITKNLWLTNMYNIKLAEPAQWGTFIEKVNKALR